MATSAVAHEAVRALRQEIARIEGRLPAVPPAPFPDAALENGRGVSTGVETLDETLGGGLARGGLIEVHAPLLRDAPASTAFALALLGRFRPPAAGEALGAPKPMLWVGTAEGARETGFPYLAGLYRLFGIGPERLLLSQGARTADALWVAGEAAGLEGLSAVLFEAQGPAPALDLTATRRLHTRARDAKRPVLLLRQAGAPTPTAAPVRFLVRSAPAGFRETLDGPLPGSIGPPAWEVILSKGGRAGEQSFELEWDFDDQRLRERASSPKGSSEAAHPGAVAALSGGGARGPGALRSVLAFPPLPTPPGDQPPQPEHPAPGWARRLG